MLVIRYSRVGKKKQPEFRLVVSEKGRDPWGKATEILGFVRHRSNPPVAQLKKDRILYWISKGAQPSASVHNMLVDQGIIKKEKMKMVHISTRRAQKLAAKKPLPSAPVKAETPAS